MRGIDSVKRMALCEKNETFQTVSQEIPELLPCREFHNLAFCVISTIITIMPKSTAHMHSAKAKTNRGDSPKELVRFNHLGLRLTYIKLTIRDFGSKIGLKSFVIGGYPPKVYLQWQISVL
jgi:hypothetical protein